MPTQNRAVTALSSHIYTQPDIKAPIFRSIPYLAEVATVAEEGAFYRLARGGYVPRVHFEARPGDAVDHARRFLGAPYLWGGRSARGLDCSALVQLAFRAAGQMDCPRDSDMQEALFGTTLAEGEAPARGDLLFWKGHVAMCTGEGTIIHANAHHMAVAEEALEGAVQRILDTGGGPVTSLRRPPVGR